jgi:hypothetical protein
MTCNNIEGNSCGLILGSIVAFAWKDWGKSWETCQVSSLRFETGTSWIWSRSLVNWVTFYQLLIFAECMPIASSLQCHAITVSLKQNRPVQPTQTLSVTRVGCWTNTAAATTTTTTNNNNNVTLPSLFLTVVLLYEIKRVPDSSEYYAQSLGMCLPVV